MPKKPPATLGIIYRMPLEDLHPHPLNPYGVRDDPAKQGCPVSVRTAWTAFGLAFKNWKPTAIWFGNATGMRMVSTVPSSTQSWKSPGKWQFRLLFRKNLYWKIQRRQFLCRIFLRRRFPHN